MKLHPRIVLSSPSCAVELLHALLHEYCSSLGARVRLLTTHGPKLCMYLMERFRRERKQFHGPEARNQGVFYHPDDNTIRGKPSSAAL